MYPTSVSDVNQVLSPGSGRGDVGQKSIVFATQLVQACGLDLSDAFTRQIQQLADLLERDATTIGDVQRAGLGEFPDLEIREVEFDRTCVRVDIEVEVEFARHEWAGAFGLAALHTTARTTLLDLEEDRFGLLSLLGGESLQGDRLASPESLTGSSFIRCSAPLGRGVAHEGNPGLWLPRMIVFNTDRRSDSHLVCELYDNHHDEHTAFSHRAK